MTHRIVTAAHLYQAEGIADGAIVLDWDGTVEARPLHHRTNEGPDYMARYRVIARAATMWDGHELDRDEDGAYDALATYLTEVAREADPIEITIVLDMASDLAYAGIGPGGRGPDGRDGDDEDVQQAQRALVEECTRQYMQAVEEIEGRWNVAVTVVDADQHGQTSTPLADDTVERVIWQAAHDMITVPDWTPEVA